MAIYEILKKDHEKVKKLLAKIEKKRDDELVEELRKEITIHNEAEEEAFYEPLQAKAGKLKIIVKAGHDEHDLVIKMLKQLDKIEDENEWMALFSVIKKSMEAHILTEEEDIFALSKTQFSKEEAQEIADDMLKLKAKFEKKYNK